MSKSDFVILIIEDNYPDVELFKKAITENSPNAKIDLRNVSTGDAAIKYLLQQPPYEKCPLPNLIVLDLNLPTLSGQEVLTFIKSHHSLKAIPVVILSTSDADKDIKECYSMYANTYITKTFDLTDLFKKIGTLSHYWLETACLPDLNNILNSEPPSKEG